MNEVLSIRYAAAWIAGGFGAALLAAGSPLQLSAADAPAAVPAGQVARQMMLPDGFQATVFAAEPDVAQPVAMTFDDRGRLWIAEFHTYADLQTNFDTNQVDRIVILEDRDGDGRHDARKVFWTAGKRLTGIAVGFGGVWALCAPHLLFLPDRDGDDVPDGEPEVVLDGWDDDRVRHTIVNGLKWGPDGWLYGRHGIQATSCVGPPGAPPGERTCLNSSLWRFHPVRRVFEVVCQGGTNPWGHDWDEHGELFFINTVIGHFWHAIPGAYYKRMYGEHLQPHRYDLIDQHADHYHWDTGQSWTASREAGAGADDLGGGHAHSGLMIYLGDNWPAEYRNDAFTLNFHGRRINRERLEREGSGYAARHQPDFVRFPDPWFRGVELAYGPDGGVFVLDWSDTGECHENDSDGVHRETGRIYKITWGRPSRPAIADVAALPDEALAELQRHRNEWFARHARRVLQERAVAGRDLGAAHQVLHAMFHTAPELPVKLRALWALHVSRGAPTAWLRDQMGHPNEHVRTWVIRLLTGGPMPPAEWENVLVAQARREPSAQVRLALASALQRLPVERRGVLAAPLLSHAQDQADHNLPLLLWYGIEPLVSAAPAAAVDLLAACQIPQVQRFIVRRLAEELNAFAQPVNTAIALATATDSPGLRLNALRGLAEGLRGWRDAPQPPAWAAFAEKIQQDSTDPDIRQLLRELSVVFGDGRALTELRHIVLEGTAAGDTRRAALRQLVEAKADDLQPVLEKLLMDPAMLPAAVKALAAFPDPDVPETVLSRLDRLSASDQGAVLEALVARASHASAVLDALGAGRLPARTLTAYHARQIQAHGAPELNARLREVWGNIQSSDTEKRARIQDLKAKLSLDLAADWDRVRGRELYKQACGVCHRLFGEGASIGPDLTGSGRDNLDYLLENIIDPNAMVPADYQAVTVDLQDERVLTGVVVSRSPQTFVLQTATERLVVNQTDVRAIEPSALSLMPEGLLDAFDSDQIRDLIRYLMSPR